MTNAAPKAMPHLPIGTVSKRTGCNIETIRYYEKIGLVRVPARTAGGHRAYSEDHVQRLDFVRRARDLGFTLDEIRALLRLAGRHDHTCAEVRDLAYGHLRDVRSRIKDLRTIERVLARMVAECADGQVPECPLLEALSTRDRTFNLRKDHARIAPGTT